MCVNSVLYSSSSFIRTHISVTVDDINDTSGLTRYFEHGGSWQTLIIKNHALWKWVLSVYFKMIGHSAGTKKES